MNYFQQTILHRIFRHEMDAVLPGRFSFVLKVDAGEAGLSIDEEEISTYYSSYIIFIFQRTEKSAKADFTLMDDGHSSHYSTQQTDSDEVPPLADYSNRKGGNR